MGSMRSVDPTAAAGMCSDGRCHDEVLLHGLESVVEASDTTTVVVLHMLGNHGPAYFKRYPAALSDASNPPVTRASCAGQIARAS